MGFADATRVREQIKYVLNAAPLGFGAAITNSKYWLEAVDQARIDSGTEVLRAIASNPMNGHHASLATLVTVAHGAFLPGHQGEPGLPLVVPFDGAPAALTGLVADPDDIDAWRGDLDALALYSGALGLAVAHNVADAQGMPSPNAGRFAFVKGQFRFTGYSAQVPLIQLTRSMADTGVPDDYEPTIIKLSIPKLVKEGDNLYVFAREYGALGREDLIEIAGGAMKVRPVPLPSIVMAQKHDL